MLILFKDVINVFFTGFAFGIFIGIFISCIIDRRNKK